MISAVVSDTSGVANLTGGTLIDQPSGTNYGAFLTPGGQGTFVYALTWQQIYQAQAITFAPGGSVQRIVIGRFFDNQGRSTEQSVTVTLECGDATSSPCSTACMNLTQDPDNCGVCATACSKTQTCGAGASCQCLAGHCTARVATTNDKGTVSGASCDAACQSLGANCVANTCSGLPTGAIQPSNAAISCSSTSTPGVCCCQQ
jgi:hypothetical protein